MNIPHLRWIPWYLGLVFVASGCAGPERAPHQPVQGVDTEKNEVENPYDRPAGGGREGLSEEKSEENKEENKVVEQPAPGPARAVPSRRQAASDSSARGGDGGGDFLDAFLDRVATAWREKQGVVAVFPALSPTPDQDTWHVNGLGDYLMEETAHGLEARGVNTVVFGHGLENDLLAAERSLADLRSPTDVYPLAKAIGADYFVFGVVRRRVLDRLRKDEALEVDWICKRAADRATVAAWRKRLAGGPLAKRLYRYYQVASTWKIGVDRREN